MASQKISSANNTISTSEDQTFRLMFESQTAIMLLIAPQTGHILEANSAALGFYGYPKAILYGMSIDEINALPPGQSTREQQKTLDERRNYIVSMQRLASGEERIVEIHSAPINFQQRQVLFSIVHDITGRNQMDRAAELVLANQELAFQNEEKGKRAAELVLANKELVFQNEEKANRAAELVLANQELVFQNEEKGKRAAELVLANQELVFQNEEKANRAAELIVVKKLAVHSEEKAKQAEAINIANGYLENLINYANAPIIVWDTQFRITRFNHAFELLTGRTEEEVLGQSLEILFPPTQAQDSMAQIRQTLLGERWESVEIAILHCDSSIRTVLWNSATVFSSDGRTPIATIAQGQDITERKRAEQNLFNTNIDLSNTVEQLDLALEELKGYRTELEMQNDELRQSQELVETTRARYFELYDLAPVGYCTISEKGLILEANLTAANLLGVPKTAIIKKPFSLFVVKEHQNIYYLKRKKLIEADSSQAFELQMLKKDGTSFWARLETSAALDINGAPMIRVTISDITEQKQADDRLRESEERYRILFQKANVGIIYLSTDLSVEMVNEAFAKMHGYSVEEMSGMRLQDLDTNKNTLLISDRMRRIVSGEVIEFEVEHYHKDGHTFQLAVSANMVSVGGGNIVQAFHRDITEQKRAEVQVNEQLKELSCLNDVSRLVFDPELTEAELCQQVAERLIGALGFPDIATAMVELNGQCYQTAQCTNLHFARLTAPILHNTQKCGQISVCYSEDNSFILPEEQNLLDNIVNILGLWRERKVSDQDVRKLSQAVEQSPVAIMISDPNGTIEYANPYFCALTGYSLDEIAGKNPRILQTGYTSKAEYQQLWETILSGKTWVGKLLNRKKNGDIYWEKASIAPMFDETGKIAHFMAVKEDITAQKTMEGNLRQSESHNRALLSAIPDMILRLSREGIILDYKANLNGLPGQAHKKIGKSVFEFLDETVAVKVKDHIDQTLRSRQMQSMEINIKIRDIVHVLEVRLKDLGDHEVVAIVRDISEQSRLEQMKSDFINRASHELRTPITTMLLMVSLLDETINKDGNNEFWDVLKSEINHERLLVEHLLRAGRLEGDQEQMSFRSIEIDELIQQVVHDLNPAAREKDITLSVETIPAADGSPRLVHADQNALTQVFVNLVGNAIKFTPRGGKVCICTQSEELGTQISISDTGLGIPSKDLPLLFNRFFRGSNAIDEEIQGTGLGLFIVRSILEKHDGNIRVTSELGKGSQFNVWLPDSQEQFSFPLNPNTYQAQME